MRLVRFCQMKLAQHNHLTVVGTKRRQVGLRLPKDWKLSRLWPQGPAR